MRSCIVQGGCGPVVTFVKDLRKGAFVEVSDVNWVIRVGMPLFVSTVSVLLVSLEGLEVVWTFYDGREERLEHVGDVESNWGSRVVLPIYYQFLPKESGHVYHYGCPFVLRDVFQRPVRKTVPLLDADVASVVFEVEQLVHERVVPHGVIHMLVPEVG